MSEHLSDMEMAMLAEGVGSQSLRSTSAMHLQECAGCMRLLVECVRSSRPDESVDTQLEGLLERAGQIPDDLLLRLLDKALGGGNEMEDSGGRSRIQALVRLAIDPGEGTFALAAKSDPDQGEELPTLALPDRSVIVHFRRKKQSGDLEAYVIQSRGDAACRIALFFPSLGKSFPVDQAGCADLQGLDRTQLLEGKIMVDLKPWKPRSK